jgi:ergothioneine biosynthesis protein EgtB
MPALNHSRASRSQAPLNYQEVRSLSEVICAPLTIEDQVLQPNADVSPPKWHLAHTTWFFETFVLREFVPGYQPVDPAYHFLFNSYYKGEGPHFERSRRGMVSRPGVEDIRSYRARVDARMHEFMETPAAHAATSIIELGLHHEQQHQELLLMDIKQILWLQPGRPSYGPLPSGFSGRHESTPAVPATPKTVSFPEGLALIGSSQSPGHEFNYDNERPAHRVFLEAYGLQSQPVSCGDYLEFIEAGGYRDHRHWLSEGWDQIHHKHWDAPLYWERGASGDWNVFTLEEGLRKIDKREPVVHLSYFEADAFARWRGSRLPTEAEWEHAVTQTGGFSEGRVWEWTSSSYSPYPGFKPLPGNTGEYNGKFMCNQYVLRGGSRATPAGHYRPTYRNFFPPSARWQFAGLRLAF